MTQRRSDGVTDTIRFEEDQIGSWRQETRDALDIGTVSEGMLYVNVSELTSAGNLTIEILTSVRNRANDYYTHTTLTFAATGRTHVYIDQLGRYLLTKAPTNAAADTATWEALFARKMH